VISHRLIVLWAVLFSVPPMQGSVLVQFDGINRTMNVRNFAGTESRIRVAQETTPSKTFTQLTVNWTTLSAWATSYSMSLGVSKCAVRHLLFR
jgi:hypothetical protein